MLTLNEFFLQGSNQKPKIRIIFFIETTVIFVVFLNDQWNTYVY